jgi:hypothetical protein
MSKVVRAANAMVANPDRISDIREKDGEFYFLFAGRYQWSILPAGSDGQDYYLTFWTGQTSMRYSTWDFDTREARQTFHELFLAVKERHLGIDTALNEIIASTTKDDVPF